MKQIEVVAAVIKDGNRIFATQRGYGEFKDMWEFPGGKMEPGEDRGQALEREIMEELDTEIDIGPFLCTVEYDYPAFHLTMHCYICSVRSGNLVLMFGEVGKPRPERARIRPLALRRPALQRRLASCGHQRDTHA